MARLRARTAQARVDKRPFTDVGREPMKAVEKIPVTEGLVECPVCGGGVKVTMACFTDVEGGIFYRKTRLYSNHAAGGRRSPGVATRCGGSGRPEGWRMPEDD